MHACMRTHTYITDIFIYIYTYIHIDRERERQREGERERERDLKKERSILHSTYKENKCDSNEEPCGNFYGPYGCKDGINSGGTAGG